jgi:hypothetical protein
MARTSLIAVERLAARISLEDLKFELARAELAQARMRAADRLLRLGNASDLVALGFSRRHIEILRSQTDRSSEGYPAFALQAIDEQIRWLRAEVRLRRSVPIGIAGQERKPSIGWDDGTRDSGPVSATDSLEVTMDCKTARKLGPGDPS